MDDLVTSSGLRLLASALDWQFARSSGPGGQSVNTSSTKVVLRADLAAGLVAPDEAVRDRVIERLGTTVTVTAQEHRSQWKNRQVARERLSRLLEDAAVAAVPRRETKVPVSEKRRRRDDKARRAEKLAGRRVWD